MTLNQITKSLCISAAGLILASTAWGADSAPASPATQPANGRVIIKLPDAANAQAAKRQAVPSPAERAKVEKLIKDSYAPYPPPNGAPRRAVAAKLLTRGKSDSEEMSMRYVMLTEAAEMAATSGDVASAVEAADLLGKTFDVDSLDLKLHVITSLKSNVMSPEERKTAAGLAIKLADTLSAESRLEEAANANSLARGFLLSTIDPQLAMAVHKQMDLIHAAQTEQHLADDAAKKLATAPDDPQANSTLGRYECIVLGKWDLGLAKIAKGSDPVLQALAKLELSKPTAADAQAKLADGWWDVADREAEGASREKFKAHAVHWYGLALGDLKGLALALAQKRIAEVPITALPDEPGQVVVSNSTDAAEAAEIVTQVARNYPEVLKGVQQLELVKYHDAAELHRNFGGPREIEGSHSAKPVTGKGGFIWLWGVYEKWDAGSYIIVYRVKAMTPVTGDNICFLDVCRGGNTIAARHPKADEFQNGAWSAMPFPLKLGGETTIEFRLWANDHNLALDRIYVFRVTEARK